MERSYVTAAFFRHRTAERYQRMQEKEMVRQLDEGAPVTLDVAAPNLDSLVLLGT
jgi:hypothetical protein